MTLITLSRPSRSLEPLVFAPARFVFFFMGLLIFLHLFFMCLSIVLQYLLFVDVVVVFRSEYLFVNFYPPVPFSCTVRMPLPGRQSPCPWPMPPRCAQQDRPRGKLLYNPVATSQGDGAFLAAQEASWEECIGFLPRNGSVLRKPVFVASVDPGYFLWDESLVKLFIESRTPSRGESEVEIVRRVVAGKSIQNEVSDTFIVRRYYFLKHV